MVLKCRVGIRRGIAVSLGQFVSMLKDGVSIKALMVVSPHHHCPLNERKMPKIRKNLNTGSEAGTLCEGPMYPGRCFPTQKRGSGHHHVSARKKWSKEVNIVVMNAIIDRILLMRMAFLLKGIGKECTGSG